MNKVANFRLQKKLQTSHLLIIMLAQKGKTGLYNPIITVLYK